MPDRERVIVELTAGIEDAYHRCHCGLAVTMENALFLLKEQEPVEAVEVIDEFYPIGDPRRTRGWECGQCHERIAWDDNYCSKCGRAVRWVD